MNIPLLGTVPALRSEMGCGVKWGRDLVTFGSCCLRDKIGGW